MISFFLAETWRRPSLQAFEVVHKVEEELEELVQLDEGDDHVEEVTQEYLHQLWWQV